jgi:hypothetical protein
MTQVNVTRVQSDATADDGTASWEITITRRSVYRPPGAPPATDLPPDIREALGKWLEGAA